MNLERVRFCCRFITAGEGADEVQLFGFMFLPGFQLEFPSAGAFSGAKWEWHRLSQRQTKEERSSSLLVLLNVALLTSNVIMHLIESLNIYHRDAH